MTGPGEGGRVGVLDIGRKISRMRKGRGGGGECTSSLCNKKHHHLLVKISNKGKKIHPLFSYDYDYKLAKHAMRKKYFLDSVWVHKELDCDCREGGRRCRGPAASEQRRRRPPPPTWQWGRRQESVVGYNY